MEDTLKVEQTEKIGSHQSFYKKDRKWKRKKTKDRESLCRSKRKHGETKAALTKLWWKQFRMEEEKKREDETNDLNNSGIDFAWPA